ncbi:MAG: hypothetical protein KDA59_24625 [Planctomycetales bacterium]|nr:hypothetical protein [Planctomycetales bacterium]MCA9223168.1 hypothetical protein [Planctomycetales bacterium]
MRTLIVGLSLLFTCVACQLHAQQPWGVDAGGEPLPTEVLPQPTQEMWFYLQEMRRYDDPKQAVRRNAEFKAAQRRLRLETQKWYGYSASRPVAAAVPYMTSYSPRWVGQTGDPYRWIGGGVPRVATVVKTETTEKSTTTTK